MPEYERLLESYPAIAPSNYIGSLKGKNALITGVSSGIGRATAKAFAAAGANVVCVARRQDAIASLVQEITETGHKALALPADVVAPGAARNIVEKAEKALEGHIDILVSVAGRARIGPLVCEDEDLRVWWNVYDLNVRAPVALIRQVLPGMVERKAGTIITVSSQVASLALPCMSAYSSSKAAMTKVHEALVPELEGTGVLTFALNPGMVESELGTADEAFNRDSMDHPATKAFLASISKGNSARSKAELPADTMVALAADKRAKALNGLHLNADQDLEAVFNEIGKENGGRIHKEELYRVRINQLL